MIGLFGVSIATATLLAVSRPVAVGDRDGIRRAVAHAMTMMFVLNVPAILGLVVLSDPIARLRVACGRLLPADTAATARTLPMRLGSRGLDVAAALLAVNYPFSEVTAGRSVAAQGSSVRLNSFRSGRAYRGGQTAADT